MAGSVRRRWRMTVVGLLAVFTFAGLPALRADDGGSGALVVGLVDGATESTVSGTLSDAGAHITRRIEQLNTIVVEPRPGSRDRLAKQLQRNPAVRYAEPDAESMAPAAVPNDPLYAGGKQWNIDRVQAPQAWDLLPRAGNTLVAVLDTGIDLTHPDLAGKISPNGCDAFRDLCGSGRSKLQPDPVGHGSHVAGILGAATNNGIGVASVSGGRVTILPIQIASTAGSAFSSTIADAIVYAVDQGAQVINISFGGGCGASPDQARRDAIGYAESHGTLIVLSAGNSGGCREGRFPQNDSRVLSVAATDIADNGASFTDRGLTVAVAAPGVNILSTVPVSGGLAGVWDPSGYAAISGTSMAAPHVAAEAALLFQVPGATKAKVVEWIMATCDSANVSARCGGRINVYRAVSLAVTGVDPAKAPPQMTDTMGPPAQPIMGGQSQPPAMPAPGRPAPPALPAGFVISDAARTATVPDSITGATPSNVSWNGKFWLSAPVVTVGVCDISDEATRAATDTALIRWTEAAGRSLAWRVTRNDMACDTAFTAPKVLITRTTIPGDDTAVSRVVSTDAAGNACGVDACWVNTAAVQLNPAAFDAISAEARAAAIMRDLARSVGLGTATSCGDTLLAQPDRCSGAPATDLGLDDIAALNELLSATLRVMRAS